MGGDGGSIPGRADIVRTAGFRFARNLGGMGYLPNTQVRTGSGKYSKFETRLLGWTTCALTGQPLQLPLAACRLGQLYNKEQLIERLLQRKTKQLPPALSHITSLKDIKSLHVEQDPKSHRLLCPVTKTEFDSGVKGVCLWTCGCVLSQKVLVCLTNPKMEKRPTCANGVKSKKRFSNTEAGADNGLRSTCPACGKTYDPNNDIVELLPDAKKLETLRAELLQNQEEKKKKKRQKIDSETTPSPAQVEVDVKITNAATDLQKALTHNS